MAVLTKEITEAKPSASDSYISNLNYKTEAKKHYKFINNLYSGVTKSKKESLNLINKMLCDGDQIDNALVNLLSAKQRKSTKIKHRENFLNRFDVFTKTLDITEYIICNMDFTEHELELAIAQLKTVKFPHCDHIFCRICPSYVGKKLRKHSFDYLIKF